MTDRFKIAGVLLLLAAGGLLIWNAGFNKGADVALCAVAIAQNDGKWPGDKASCAATAGWQRSPLGVFRQNLPDSMK